MEHGLVHLYTGDGKGKTTAAGGADRQSYGCGGFALAITTIDVYQAFPTLHLAVLSTIIGLTVSIWLFFHHHRTALRL